MSNKKLRRVLVPYVSLTTWMQKVFVLFASLIINGKVFRFDEKPELFQFSGMRTEKSGIKSITNSLFVSNIPFGGFEVSQLWGEGSAEIGSGLLPDIKKGDASSRKKPDKTANGSCDYSTDKLGVVKSRGPWSIHQDPLDLISL